MATWLSDKEKIIYRKLRKQKPINLTTLPNYQLKRIYKKYERRKYAKISEIFIYWMRRLPYLVYSENNGKYGNICFACRKRYKKGALDRCHLVCAFNGGPGQAWNIVYLCPECHELMDSTFFGNPSEYYEQINWIKNRYQNISNTFIQSIENSVYFKKIKTILEKDFNNRHLEFVKFFLSKEADKIHSQAGDSITGNINAWKFAAKSLIQKYHTE